MSIDKWMLQKSKPLSPWPTLGKDICGVVSWNMNDTCNYRCSYCTQRHMPDRTGKIADIENTVSAFRALQGNWEFKLSGGEPFRQPGLNEIAQELVAMGHVISIQTNFSANETILRQFLESTRNSLHVFSASLHLEYATPEEFVAKYSIIREYEPLGVKFHVTSVGIPAELLRLKNEIAPFFEEHGITLKVQPEKIRGYVRNYSDEEIQLLLELGGHNLTGKIENNFQGKLCHSGANYIVVKSSGEAFRCYPASRVGGKFARIGSLTEGFDLLSGPKICPYTYCNCTVPIQRGMIEGVSQTNSNMQIEFE